MSLQMPVTEDTPPDMLSGAMDLNVILPNGSVIKMSVERSTPMMDLLVQITTAHKLSPGSHAIHAIGDRGVLPYKPSTPIGTLDTWTVNIVPKNQSKNGRYQSQSIIKCISKPFEQTFRLQVYLPRNQLYVARVSPKTQLNKILKQVCMEKNLDPIKYTLRKPDKLNEPLDLNKTLVEYKLQQLSLVLNTNRTLIGGLSSEDIMSRSSKQFSCDDSLSSGSLGGRSLSPTRSDESSDTPRRPLMVKVLPSRPVRKRRLAPKPPLQQRNAPEQTLISHSRNSSDSSGYHESSVLSDALDCRVEMTKSGKFSPAKTPGQSMSRSMTNLQVCGQTSNQFSEIPFISNNIGQSKHSVSTTSLISIQSRKKKAAPPPPVSNKPKLAPPQEESENEQEPQRKSQTLPVSTKMYMTDVQEKSKTVSRIELNNNVVEPNLSPATSSLSSLSRSDVDRDLIEPTSPTSSTLIGCKYDSKSGVKSKRLAPKPPIQSSTINRLEAAGHPLDDLIIVPQLSSGSTADEDELRMDDEEIDRIFGDATSGYDTPSIITVKENNTDATDIEWEYKLPDPPSAFRDNDHSPTLTMFDTVTIGNLKDVVLHEEPSDDTIQLKEDSITMDETVKKIFEDEYHCFPQDSGVGSDDSSLPSSCEEKLHVDDKPVKIVEPKESKLNNFKIVTYDEDCSKPTEIFCDESVKTWKTTQMARESNPAYKSQITNSINRHKSFCTDRTNFAITIKRSTSHISLLSGNIKPSNRLSKHYIGRTYSSEKLNGVEPLVKRSFSVDDITEDVHENNQDEYEKKILPKRNEPTLEQTSPLHSLQIIKTILPQIEDYKSKENHQNNSLSFNEYSNVPDTSFVETRSNISSKNEFKENSPEMFISEQKIEIKNPCSQQTTSVNKPLYQEMMSQRKPVTTESPIARHHAQLLENTNYEEPCRFKTSDVQRESDDNKSAAQTSNDKDKNVKKYVYAGPPKISLSTWNERPKRQVSIKTDRDYVIGIRQRLQQKADTPEKLKGSAAECKPVSRVPIVKSVELKKPYAEQLQTANPVLPLSEAIKAQSKLSNGYNSHHGNTTIRLGGDDNNAKPSSGGKKYDSSSLYTFGKLMAAQPRKPREISTNVNPRESLLESIRSFGGRDNLRKIRAQ